MNAVFELLSRPTAGDWFVLAGSVGTILLALTALAQGRRIASQDRKIDQQANRIERQIAASEKQVAIAQKQADDNTTSIELARRTHIDQGAPDVFVTLEAPQGPQVDPERSQMPGADELRLLDPASFIKSNVHSEWEFHLDSCQNYFLWFYGRGLVTNEGQTTARVRISPEAQYVSGPSPIDASRVLQLPHIEDEGTNPVAILAPGDQALFEWAAGHNLGEWAQAHQDQQSRDPGGSIWLWIVTFDTRELGVIDTQMVHIQPDPIRPITNKSGHWKFTSTPLNPIAPLPKRRHYRHDGWYHEDISQMTDYHQQRDPQ